MSTQYQPYAGIGSRETPAAVLDLMRRIATSLERKGFTLRSGGANGADSAFEAGATFPEVFLPWRGFNGRQSPYVTQPAEAFELAAALHPAWPRLSVAARKLMARNCQQILGEHLNSPSQFVVCWTPDGCERHEDRSARTGGTGQAISLASMRGVPVFNLARADAMTRLKAALAALTKQNSC